MVDEQDYMLQSKRVCPESPGEYFKDFEQNMAYWERRRSRTTRQEGGCGSHPGCLNLGCGQVDMLKSMISETWW